MRLWWFLIVFVVTFSLAMCAFMVGGVRGTQFMTKANMVSNRFSTHQTTLVWPADPPVEWPPPAQVYRVRGPFVEYFHAISVTDGVRMEVYRYGWPIPVLEHRRQFWPWDDPTFATDAPPDSGLIVLWRNLLSLSLAVAVFFGSADLTLRSVVRRCRRRKGRCVKCGCTLCTLTRCRECGVARERTAGHLPASSPSVMVTQGDAGT